MNRLEYYHRYSRFSQTFFPPAGQNPGSISGKMAHAPANGEKSFSGTAEELYRFHEFRYTSFISKAWQLNTGIPWQQYKEERGDDIRRRSGWGDLSSWIQYGLIRKDSLRKSLRWFAGAGLRVPTGWHYRDSARYTEYFFEQGGKGVGGYMLISSLNYRIGKIGITSLINWNYLFRNKHGLRPGSILNASQYVFMILNIKYPDIRLVPAASFYLEFTEGNRADQYQMMNTGGTSVLAGPDVTLYMKRWSIRAAMLMPLYEKMNGSQPLNMIRVQTGISYNFGKNAC